MNCPECESPMRDADICERCGFDFRTVPTTGAYPLTEDETLPTYPSTIEARKPTARVIADQSNSFRGLLVHGLLGEGAMGSTFLASHLILRMPLVIKTFKVQDRQDVFNEAHLAARVVSPNVVGVVDAGRENGIPFVIQRYVDGIDLAELLKFMKEGNWTFPLQTICRILIDAAKGLHSIHQAGVIHRDVKPANLFLTGDGTTTVGDFGIAVDLSRSGGEDVVSGTPMFMAPEQWKGEELGRYTDIYALGVTGHFLVTGKPPFEPRSAGELYTAHTTQKYNPPPATNPEEAYVASVIERSLRKAPEERYQTAEAFARVLEILAEPAPMLVRTDPNEARVGPLQIELIAGDITRSEGDVVVNAANSKMEMDLGVAAALSRAAGPTVAAEASKHAPASMGDVVWTGAGNLKARWVAHAVSAMSGAVCLQRCTLRTLLGAEVRKARVVVFPALGTGVGDVPMDLAAKLMLEAIQTFAAFNPRYVKTVRIVLFETAALARWRTVLESI